MCAPPAGWTAAKGYVDPFPSDAIKYTVTKANAAQYKDKLTPGTLAMLNKYDNFKMNVYETRRTACYPQSVYDEVKALATRSSCRASASRVAARPCRSRSRRTASRRSGTTSSATSAAAWIASTTASRCAATATSSRWVRTSTASSTPTWTSRRTICCSRSCPTSRRRRRSRARCSWCTSRWTR